MARKIAPIHPGEILLEEFLEFWLNLQVRFDLESERDRLGKRLVSEVQVLKKAG